MQDSSAQSEYNQGAERRLLTKILGSLDNKVAVDVGAERGAFVRAFLEAGAEAVYAFEPFPRSVEALQAAFVGNPTVQVFGLALGECDDDVVLHVVEDKSGSHADAFHSLVAFDETPTLRIVHKMPVECRSLASLVREGIIPADVGVLKVDAERSDFAILRGMGPLTSAVTMIEYWDDLAETVGPAAYRVGDVVPFMAERGYTNFVVVKRHDQFEALYLNDEKTRPGDRGNVIFIHDTVFPRLAAIVYAEVAAAQQRLVDQAKFFAGEAERRLDIIERSSQEADAHAAARVTLETELAASTEKLAANAEKLATHDAELATRDAQLATRDDELAALEAALAAQITITASETRLEMLEEQEQALEAYLRLSLDGALWRWVSPQLGVLYQHEPAPFYVPEHYLRVGTLSSPPPLISIVTPTMNSDQFVAFTIDSVLDQGYPNLEYIIQDGHSTDDTLTVVETYGSRIAHVNSARDTGMSQAINRGFRHATGDILAYLNSDDLLLPGALHYVASYFETHPDVDVVYGHRVIVDMSNAEIGRWVLPPHDSDVLSWADYVPQETLFWRRRIWDEIGSAMDESYRFACDWDLLLRFREAGARFTRLPRFLGAFRVHEEQKTSKQLADVGASEMNRLRERYVGRPVDAEEIWQHIQPYLHRHKVYHKLYRLGVLRY